MRVASLFAGLGGFDLALERLGLHSSLVAEIDPAARRVLTARFPRARLEGDARAVNLHGFDLVTAGFPCQGLSPAAATRAHEGLIDPRSRSSVVWQIVERIHEARVPLALFKNSSALTTARYADDMKALLIKLEQYGYETRVYILNAGCYGTPMRRLRAFIMATRRGASWPTPLPSASWECASPVIGLAGQQGGAAWCLQPSPTLKAGTYTLCVTRDDLRTLTPEAVEVLMGLPLGHTAPAGAASHRYERLGNAVSVDAADAALRILLGLAPRASLAPRPYPLDLTVRARGGTSGSMVRRIHRSLVLGRGNHNRIELDYALPVYAQRMQDDPATVSAEQRAALAWLIANGAMPTRPPAWPDVARVTMTQPGLLPPRTVPVAGAGAQLAMEFL